MKVAVLSKKTANNIVTGDDRSALRRSDDARRPARSGVVRRRPADGRHEEPHAPAAPGGDAEAERAGQRQRRRRRRAAAAAADVAAAAAAVGMSSATASISAPAENFLAAMRLAVEILKEPAYPQDEFDRIKTQRLKALEADADRADPARRRSAEPAPESVREGRRAVRADARGAAARAAEGDARRRAEVPRSVLRRELRRLRRRRPGRRRPTSRRPRPSCFGSWNTTKAYKPLVTPFKKVAPINEKIETPDKANAAVPGRRAVPAVAERSRLPGDRPGQLHVRRADHLAHLRSHPQSRGPELRRQRADHRARRKAMRPCCPAR